MFIARWIKRIVYNVLMEKLDSVFLELSSDKNYILILPVELDADAVHGAFKPLQGKVNIVILQADNVRLVELS